METSEQISARMRKQKSKKTKAEVLLAKALWHKGLRYRLNLKTLPGTPDIVITKYKIAIFVDGEFWHGKDFEKTENVYFETLVCIDHCVEEVWEFVEYQEEGFF